MDILLEEREDQTVHYYCIATDYYRYDISIIYSNLFCGKAMVISIQTGKMVLMCKEDIENEEYWLGRLGINTIDVPVCRDFLLTVLDQKQFANQY